MNALQIHLSRFQHVSDESISRLIAGELSPLADLRVSRHMVRCWQCRSRREAMERAAMRLTEHRRLMAARVGADPQRRALLLAALRQRAQQQDHRASATKSLFATYVNPGYPMNPLFASFAIVLTATLLLFWIWQRPSVPVSAGQLMLGAQMAERRVSEGKPGVVYQKIRIASATGNIEREIYRDARDQRHTRPQGLQVEATHVRSLFSRMDIDWDNPLSPASFRAWHDRQPGAVDRVTRKEGNLLTLETTVPNSWIEAESLTVRADDFHPVERTIRTSDNTIQVAELNYAVLDWGGVNDALFEPLPASPSARPVLHAVVPAPLPSAMVLDRTELAALLALNHLQADQGEQIAVARDDRAVQVKGIVETGARKEEIVRALANIPLVHIDVLSIAELQQQPSVSTMAQSVSMQSVDVTASPLQRYLTTTDQTPEVQQRIARTLLDSALQMKQSAIAIENLRHRFPSLATSSPTTSSPTTSAAMDSAYRQLLESYSRRLRSALDEQESALRSLGSFPNNAAAARTPADDAGLSPAVERNESLCRELIAGNTGDGAVAERSAPRSAPEIIPDLIDSIAHIRARISLKNHS